VSASTHSGEGKLQITDGPWASAWKIAAGVGALGLLGAGAGFASDAKRFAFSYLFAVTVFLTLSLGALFFVVLQHIAAAHWSVGIRRTAEFFVSGIPAMVVLFLPLFAVMQHFPQWEHYGHGASHETPAQTTGAHGQAGHGEHGQQAAGEHGQAAGAHGSDQELAGIHHVHHQTLEKKKAWFGSGFFYVRQALYLIAWVVLARRFFKLSTDQDKSKDKSVTVTSARSAPLAIAILALTMTFAAFDWLMALEPAWYSTIFGVAIFSGAMVAALAAIILVGLALKRAGYIGDAVNTEHFHDLGKLLFGFNCFWAYIAFSQFFLIWYASIPEETVFYHARWNDNPAWQPVSMALVFFHFVFPFVMLMSRNIKRRMGWLASGATLLLVMHAIEIYWLVLPMFKAGGHGAAGGDHHALPIHWVDFACLLGVGGAYLAMVFRSMTQHALIPVGDPRLARSKQHSNI
jgi:hypothetical protein